MTYSVKLNIYDISGGMAKQFSQMLLGKTIQAVYHTGIVVHGREYYFGGGICSDLPSQTPFGQPYKSQVLGQTEITKQLFHEFLQQITPKYTQDSYDVFNHNCNNFTDECANFLLGKGIPQEIIGLPEQFLSTQLGQSLKPFLASMQDSLKQKSNPVFGAGGPTQASAGGTSTGQPQSAFPSGMPTGSPGGFPGGGLPGGGFPGGGFPGAGGIPGGFPGGLPPNLQQMAQNLPPNLQQMAQNLPPNWQQMAQQYLGGGAAAGAAPSTIGDQIKPKVVVQITTLSDLENYKQNYKAIALDCWSPNCPPCMAIKPEFEKFAEQFKDIKFLSANTQISPSISQALSITSIPRFFFFYRGQEVEKFVGASKVQLQKAVFGLAQRLVDEKKVMESYKVFNPFKKIPILFESKSNVKVMLTRIKELVIFLALNLQLQGNQKQSVQNWLKQGLEFNEGLLDKVDKNSLVELSQLVAQISPEQTLAVFDFFRILCLKESFLKFIVSDCWSYLEIIFVSLTDSIEGSATPKQMNAMLIALRFLCNIFAHKVGRDFFNDGNIDGVFFFLNGAMNKGGEKSPKIVNACSGFLYNLRTFYSGNQELLNQAGMVILIILGKTLTDTIEILPKLIEADPQYEGTVLAICSYLKQSKELSIKFRKQLEKLIDMVIKSGKKDSMGYKAIQDLQIILKSMQ